MKLLAALLLLVPTVGQAANQDREAGLTLAQEIVLGRESSRYSDCPVVAAHVYKRFDLLTAAGIELSRSLGHVNRGHFSTQELGDIDQPPDGKADSLNYVSSVRTTVTRLSAELKFGKSDEEVAGGIRPYAVVGGGVYLVQNKAGTASLKGFTSANVDAGASGLTVPLRKRNEFDAGLNAGFGFIAKVANSFELAADLRYHAAFLHGGSTLYLLVPGLKVNALF